MTNIVIKLRIVLPLCGTKIQTRFRLYTNHIVRLFLPNTPYLFDYKHLYKTLDLLSKIKFAEISGNKAKQQNKNYMFEKSFHAGLPLQQFKHNRFAAIRKPGP